MHWNLVFDKHVFFVYKTSSSKQVTEFLWIFLSEECLSVEFWIWVVFYLFAFHVLMDYLK